MHADTFLLLKYLKCLTFGLIPKMHIWTDLKKLRNKKNVCKYVLVLGFIMPSLIYSAITLHILSNI